MTAVAKKIPLGVKSLGQRVADYDWGGVHSDLDASGCAVLKQILAPSECQDLAALYPDEKHFRSHIHMARHGFGMGEYKYFRYPLPDVIAELRTALYSRVATQACTLVPRMAKLETLGSVSSTHWSK